MAARRAPRRRTLSRRATCARRKRALQTRLQPLALQAATPCYSLQAQLAALRLPPPIGMSTAIDTGDWHSIHPPDKQAPSQRLAAQALSQIYG